MRITKSSFSAAGTFRSFELKGALVDDFSARLIEEIEASKVVRAVLYLDSKTINEVGLKAIAKVAIHFNLLRGGVCIACDRGKVYDMLSRSGLSRMIIMDDDPKRDLSDLATSAFGSPS